MGTGASRGIAISYQDAMDDFLEAYEKASTAEQLEWASAKAEIEESKKVLEDKLQRADDGTPGDLTRSIAQPSGQRIFLRHVRAGVAPHE